MRATLTFLFLSFFAACSFADDLTVGWISRLPEIDYVRNSSNPRVEGWPGAGDVVTWRAHVVNFGPARDSVAYQWSIDGRTVSTGRTALTANGDTTLDLSWTWTFSRHAIALSIDTDNRIAEESETNNALAVDSDALAVGFWVEQSIYEYFRANQGNLRVGSTSFENWAQRQIAYYNDMAALAVYPETPDGVLDRWRIQKIVVVPDGALPLTPIEGVKNDSGEATGSSHPNIADRTVDLMWGFRAITLSNYANTRTADPSNMFYLAPVFIHELGHARYLTDVYGWNVRNQAPGYRIDITEGGASILGPYIPRAPYVYYTPEQGLMNEPFTFIDRYSAIALNRIAGTRAREGNYNDPDDVGSFLNDLPAQNRITIRDRFGNLMTNASVRVYQSVGDARVWYATHYDDIPDLDLRSDDKGQVLVGRNPFSSGPIVNYFGGSNTVAIVRVEKSGQIAYGFLESRLFNLEYWRGHTAFADHELVVGQNVVCSNKGPVLRGPAWDAKAASPSVTLAWDAIVGARSYDVWASTNLGTPRLIAKTQSTTVDVRLNGHVYWWVEAQGDLCMPRRSSPGRFDAPDAAAVKRRAARH